MEVLSYQIISRVIILTSISIVFFLTVFHHFNGTTQATHLHTHTDVRILPDYCNQSLLNSDNHALPDFFCCTKMNPPCFSMRLFGRDVRYTFFHTHAKIDFPIGVLSYKKERRDLVRNTWAFGQAGVFFFVGKRDGVWPIDEFYYLKDLVLVDIEEEYQGVNSSLSFKTNVLFHMMHAAFINFSYLLKTDDDSYVDLTGLKLEIRKLRPHYWGKVKQNQVVVRKLKSSWYISKELYKRKKFPDYCLGAGYIVSYKTVTCFLTKMESHVNMQLLEDVSTGLLVKNACLNFLHLFIYFFPPIKC